VTVTGHGSRHEPYVNALVIEASRWRGQGLLGETVETVYVGGGTPSELSPELMETLLDVLPQATVERTVECNPETVSPDLARVLAERDVRVSLGAQSFNPRHLATLERLATPDTVRDAVATLRAAGVANLSLDLIYGIPGESEDDLARDLDAIIALAPDHCSAYELEAKPGTRFTHHHGAALAAEADAIEGHYDLVIDRLVAAGYDWYETASFARDGRRGVHNSAYWSGADYIGVGIGAVSTVGERRWRNRPRLEAYLEAVADGHEAPCEIETIDASIRLRERLILGLRLREGVALAEVAAVVDVDELGHLVGHGIVAVADGRLRLERRGRLLYNDVIARLLVSEP
jgi:oxygen-independent coproporphyrinogen-3 oxidase